MDLYFDNAATTQVDPRVLEVMEPYFLKRFGNPGSMHSQGLDGKDALEKAREKVAGFFNCSADEIVFTGSGTESINMALKGVAYSMKGRLNFGAKTPTNISSMTKNPPEPHSSSTQDSSSSKIEKYGHIITQKTEHHAVLEVCEFLKKEGFEVTYLDVDVQGLIRLDDLKAAIRDDTILVSIMYANNEIGTIQPISEIAGICREKGVKFHTDACQATGYLDMDVKNLGVDLMSVNGSKMHGPKGVGALYVKTGTPMVPLIHGGGQENRLRSGTENVPLIVGFSKALEIVEEEKEKEVARLTELRDYFIRELTSRIPKSFLNGHSVKRLPNNVNVSFLDVEGEAILLYLDQYGICASTGSACTSKTLDPSHVILALGRPYEAAHGSIRFSLGRYSTKEGIDKVLDVLPGVVEHFRKLSPVNLNAGDFGLEFQGGKNE
jgi:cysteine desulfurase